MPRSAGENPKDKLVLQDDFEPEFFDFTTEPLRTASMLDPKLVLSYNSRKGTTTTLGGKLLIQSNNMNGTGTEGPILLRVARLKPGSKDLIGFPTREAGPSTIPVIWPEKGTDAKLDLKYLLQQYPFVIQNGQRAFIPMELKTTAKHGTGVVFKFSEATFALITPKRTNKKSGTGESKAPSNNPNDKQNPPQPEQKSDPEAKGA